MFGSVSNSLSMWEPITKWSNEMKHSARVELFPYQFTPYWVPERFSSAHHYSDLTTGNWLVPLWAAGGEKPKSQVTSRLLTWFSLICSLQGKNWSRRLLFWHTLYVLLNEKLLFSSRLLCFICLLLGSALQNVFKLLYVPLRLHKEKSVKSFLPPVLKEIVSDLCPSAHRGL